MDDDLEEFMLDGRDRDDLSLQLWWFCESGHLAGAKRCLELGAKPRMKHGGEKTTPLIRAALKGQLEMVKLLIPLSRLNDVDCIGDTAAMRCCEEGQPECLRLLIDAGADLEKPNNQGMRPLTQAFKFGAGSWCSKGADDDAWAECLDMLIPACDIWAIHPATGTTLFDIAAKDVKLGKLSQALGAERARREQALLSKTVGKVKAKKSPNRVLRPRRAL